MTTACLTPSQTCGSGSSPSARTRSPSGTSLPSGDGFQIGVAVDAQPLREFVVEAQAVDEQEVGAAQQGGVLRRRLEVLHVLDRPLVEAPDGRVVAGRLPGEAVQRRERHDDAESAVVGPGAVRRRAARQGRRRQGGGRRRKRAGRRVVIAHLGLGCGWREGPCRRPLVVAANGIAHFAAAAHFSLMNWIPFVYTSSADGNRSRHTFVAAARSGRARPNDSITIQPS